MKYRAVHFDMDGVIANTEPLHISAEQQTCRDFDLSIDPDQWRGFKGRTAEAIFSHLREEYGNPDTPSVPELIDHKTSIFVERAWEEGIEPIEGSIEFIRWVRLNANIVTLVTSSNHRVKDAILGYLGLQRIFDVKITGDDVTRGKPDPEPYIKAMRLSGATPESSLVVEDSKAGIISALGAQCAVLAITSSHPAEELRDVHPTYIVDSYAEARKIL